MPIQTSHGLRLTKSEAAEFLGRSTRQIQRLIASRQLAYTRAHGLRGDVLLFNPTDLRRFQEERQAILYMPRVSPRVRDSYSFVRRRPQPQPQPRPQRSHTVEVDKLPDPLVEKLIQTIEAATKTMEAVQETMEMHMARLDKLYAASTSRK